MACSWRAQQLSLVKTFFAHRDEMLHDVLWAGSLWGRSFSMVHLNQHQLGPTDLLWNPTPALRDDDPVAVSHVGALYFSQRTRYKHGPGVFETDFPSLLLNSAGC